MYKTLPKKVFKKILFTFRERRREGEQGRETAMCERYISWLLLACPQQGTRPTTQACVRTGTEPVTLGLAGWHSITEPHQPGQKIIFNENVTKRKIIINTIEDFQCSINLSLNYPTMSRWTKSVEHHLKTSEINRICSVKYLIVTEAF